MGTDLSQFKKSNKNVLQSIPKREGRPPKKEDEKMNQKVTVNFTTAEKEKLLALSRKYKGLPLTMLIRDLLIENGYI
jgi:hypothetical protein